MSATQIYAGGHVPPAHRTAYHDRMRSPRETVELVRPHFGRLGITRIARQTSLDCVGIPCFAATRPNSCSIATNQGKGADDASAEASAVMEAVEFAVAEDPLVAKILASAIALDEQGLATWDPSSMLPFGSTFDRDCRIAWLTGHEVMSGGTVMVPLEAVAMNGLRNDLEGICQNTNGLASGNTVSEATFHAVCELIERDAATLWSLKSTDEKRSQAVIPEAFGEPLVEDFVRRFESAGLAIRLFDQTSDLGIPTVLAVSAPTNRSTAKHFDVATGAGTHPDPSRAALRAITEAAQTRVTSIAGARDDYPPGLYRLDGAAEAFELVACPPARALSGPIRGLPPSAEGLLAITLDALTDHGITDLVSVDLAGDELRVAVVRVLSRALEDRGPNANWRPGPRSLARLLRAA